MKNLLFYILITLLVVSISCSPSKTEIWINEDGSGNIKTTMDLGEYFDMLGPMMEGFENDIKTDEPEEDTEDDSDEEVISLSDKMWESGEEDMDSTMVFYDIMPDSVKALLDHPEYMKNIVMHMKTNAEERTAFMSIKVDFDNSDHYVAIKEELRKSKQEEGEGVSMGAGSDDELEAFFEDFTIDLKNKIIIFPETDISELIADDPEANMFISKIDSFELYAADSYEKMMMNMLFGSEIEYIIHTPGTIVSCSRDDAVIDGSSVIFRVKLIDSIKNGKQEAIAIKYK